MTRKAGDKNIRELDFAGLASLAVSSGTPLQSESRKRDRGRKNHHKGTKTLKPFVSWDGEAAGDGIGEMQDYCLIGNSSNGILLDRNGALDSLDIIEFLLKESVRLGEVIHVAFGFNYDVNHILRDMPFNFLRRLHQRNVARHGQYKIEWFPNKWFSVSHRRSKRFIRIYDTIGFWASSLIKAIESDPKLRNHPSVERIRSGKLDRGTFSFSELDSKVIPYFQAEMDLHRQLMENLRETLDTVDMVPWMWYGPSAVIANVYKRTNLKQLMDRPESDLTRERRIKHGRIQKPDKNISYTIPDKANEAARASFAGGRFEQFKIGYYEGPVYGYDITSAYPYAMLSLPSLRGGKWFIVDHEYNGESELPWGFYYLRYDYADAIKSGKLDFKRMPPFGFPHPLFRRDEWSRISYPFKCEGWYPSHSANALWKDPNLNVRIAAGWGFKPGNDINPFARDMLDFQTMFDQRMRYRKEGREDLAYAYKIALNSGYGKTAQRKGVELGDNLPAYHQLEWAAHITDHCRIQIWNAALEAYRKGGLVAIETDAVYTTERLDIESPGLGGFTCEKYDGICYLQSGVYFTKKGGDWTFHMRGLASNALTIDQVYEHLDNITELDQFWPPLYGATHTFNGIGYSRISDTGPDQFYDKWLRWKDSFREIQLGTPGLKRVHIAKYCKACKAGLPPSKALHDLFTPKSHAGVSYPRKDSWIPEDDGVLWKDKEAERWN